ncbi:MAG: hypothetical protein AABP62_10100 [Planctomycetota bacterium]
MQRITERLNPSARILMLAAIWTLAFVSGGPSVAIGQPGAAANTDAVRPESFGAKGDGKTNDRAAVQAAFDAVLQAGGGRIEFTGGKTYNLGDLPTFLAAGVNAENLTNAVIEGNGAKLVVNTTEKFTTEIFNLTNPSNVRINNLKFQDTGMDWFQNWKGAVAIRLVASGPAGESGDVSVTGCSAEQVLTFVSCAGGGLRRLRGVTVNDCKTSNSYYGINCQNDGDNLTASKYVCNNVRRPYFVYGIEGHDVEVSIHHDGKARGASSACLINNHGRDTKDVKLKATFTGDTSQYLTGLDLEHQRSDAGGGLISDVDATVVIKAPSAMVPVRFRSYRLNDKKEYVEEDATANSWDGIKLRGTLATKGPEAIAFGKLISQGTKGQLTLDSKIVLRPAKRPNCPAFDISTEPGLK